MVEQKNSQVSQDICGPGSSDDAILTNLLIFTVHTLRCAVPAEIVYHVVRMVAITPVPKAPSGIIGIINYHGEIIPVFSLRLHFSLPNKDCSVTDFLLIVQKKRKIAVIAEKVDSVSTLHTTPVTPDSIFPGISGIEGVYQCEDGLLILTDPEKLFSLEDEETLRKILEGMAGA